jgi:hypothetical protein
MHMSYMSPIYLKLFAPATKPPDAFIQQDSSAKLLASTTRRCIVLISFYYDAVHDH